MPTWNKDQSSPPLAAPTNALPLPRLVQGEKIYKKRRHKCTNQPSFTTFKWILACSDCLDLIQLDKSNLLHLDPRLDTLASESKIYIVFISRQAATECWLHVTWPSVEVVVSLRSASVMRPNGFIQEAKLIPSLKCFKCFWFHHF